jgi:hypothetical protein
LAAQQQDDAPAGGVAVDPKDPCVTVTPRGETKAELGQTAAQLSHELRVADADPVALKQSKEGASERAALTDGQIILDPPQDGLVAARSLVELDAVRSFGHGASLRRADADEQVTRVVCR